jgi:hypothetical protein
MGVEPQSVWHDVCHVIVGASAPISALEPQMGEVIRFVPKSEIERARLIREARAIYDRIFPAADSADAQRDDAER